MNAAPVDAALNPSNSAQRYVLWGNGRIDAVGGAVPITDGPRWFDRVDQPVARALHITDWATGRGYVLDKQGGFQPLNGAPSVMTESGGTVTNSLGLPYVAGDQYVDWSWDPSGSGQGYVLDHYGQLYAFGGAVAPPRAGMRWTYPAAQALAMSWSPDTRAITLDRSGGLHADFAAVVGAGGPFWLGQDIARDLAVTDWTNGRGYVLDRSGAAQPFGGAATAGPIGPYRPGADVARTLDVLSAANPVRLWQVWSGGQRYEYVLSTPPTVVAGGENPVSPAASVTTTTRPVLSWAYSDPQRDSQKAWELYVFTQVYCDGHTMTDPAAHRSAALVAESGVNSGTRGLTCPVDLSNGAYRLFARARDSAGQWSAWDDHGWTQNVVLPAAPTGLTATVDQARFAVQLSVSATAGGAADLVRFEASDDGELTWAPVRGADAVPLAATTTAVDYDIPLGVDRTYRALAYAADPAVTSAASGTTTGRCDDLTFVLTAVGAPALGGEVDVEEPVEWTRPVVAGVFQGIGAKYPTIVSDGEPKARRTTLHLMSLDRAAWQLLEHLATSNATLVYRDPFGEVMYCRLVGDWKRAQLVATPTPEETTPVRHLHTCDLDLVEVRPPHLEVND